MTIRIHGPGVAGKTVHIQSPKCTIGSADGCTLRLRSAGVEAASCWILRGSSGAIIRRLEGAALLNGQSFDEALLEPGDRLQIGSVELELVKLRSDSVVRPSLLPPPTLAEAPASSAPALMEVEGRLAEAEKLAALRASEITAARTELIALQQQLAGKQAAEGALRTAADQARRELAVQSATALRREQELAEVRTAAAAERQRWDKERATFETQLAQLAADLRSARAAAVPAGTMTVPLGSCSPAESEAQSRCLELENRVSQLQTQNQDLQGTLAQQAELEERCRRLSLELDIKCRDFAELQVRESAAAARARSQTDLDERSEALARWQDELTQRGERLTTAEQRLNEERQSIESHRGELETERRRLAAEQNELTAERQRLLSDQAALAADREAIAAERNSLAADKNAQADAQADAEKVQAREKRLEQQAEELTQWSNSLAEQAESLNQQDASLNQRGESLNQQAAEIEALRQQLEEQRAILAERARQLEEQTGDVEPPQRQLKSLRQPLAEERAVVDSQSQLADPQAEQQAAGPPDADAEPPADRDSSSVDNVLSRLVQAGLWRQEESHESRGEKSPASESPAAEFPADERPAAAAINRDTAIPDSPAFSPAKDVPGMTIQFDNEALSSAAAPATDEEESIESYMERLMQRVRGDASPTPTSANRAEPAAPKPPVQESTKVAPPASPSPAPPPVESGEFMPRSTAPELGSNLSAMRELANNAARTAIDHHLRRYNHRQVTGKLLGAGFCLAAGGFLGYCAWRQPSLITAAGAALSAALAALRLATGLRFFSKARQLDRVPESQEAAA
jgi:hypothetical protein